MVDESPGGIPIGRTAIALRGVSKTFGQLGPS